MRSLLRDQKWRTNEVNFHGAAESFHVRSTTSLLNLSFQVLDDNSCITQRLAINFIPK